MFTLKYTIAKHIFGIQIIGAMFAFALIAVSGA